MPREALNSDTSFNKIRNWLNNPEAPSLSVKDKEIFERLKFAYDQLQIENKKNVVSRMMKFFNLGQSQAYIDVENSIKLLNPINKQDKELMRIWLVNDIRKNIMSANQIQDQDKKFKLLEKLYERFYKALGLDKDEENKIDPEMLGNNTLLAQFIVDKRKYTVNFDKMDSYKPETREKIIESVMHEISDKEAANLMGDDEGPFNK